MEHLGPPMGSRMRDLGKIKINEALISLSAKDIGDLIREKNLPGLVPEMDQLLAQINILKQKTKEIS